MTARLLTNITLLLSSIFLTALGTEIYLQKKKPLDKSLDRAKLAAQAGIDFDQRGKFDVIADLRADGIDAFPAFFGVYPIQIDDKTILPLHAGVPNKTTVYCNESGQYLVYKSDPYGFHNPSNIWKETLTAALIGDSFAQGACVASNQNLAGILNSQSIPSISLGRGGNGPLHELALLKEYIEPLKPKVVFWLYFQNDLDDLEDEKKKATLVKYLEDPNFKQKLFSLNSRMQAPVYEQARQRYERAKNNKTHVLPPKPLAKENYLAGLIKFSALQNIIDTLSEKLKTPRDYDTLAEVLRQAEKTVSTWNGKLYFIYLPSWAEIKSLDYFLRRDRTKVLKTAKQLGLSVIDLYPIFKKHPDPLSLFPFKAHGHYNKQGYKIVAQHLLTHLQKLEENRNGLLP